MATDCLSPVHIASFNMARWPDGSYVCRVNFSDATTRAPTFHTPQQGACTCAGYACLDYGLSECENFHARILCDDQNCRVGLGCGNRFIQTHSFAVVRTHVGYGLQCSRPLERGAFVLEYTGQLVSSVQATTRSQHYLMALSTPTQRNEQIYIDASLCGGEARFINHSCDPNCEWYEFETRASPRVGIFTTRRIRAGEEITVSYTDRGLHFRCRCGSRLCRDQ